jgi:hypothetical protein
LESVVAVAGVEHWKPENVGALASETEDVEHWKTENVGTLVGRERT